MQIGRLSSYATFAATQSLRSNATPSQPAASPTTSAVAQPSTTADYRRMTPAQMKGEAKALYDGGRIDLTQLHLLQTVGVPIGKAVDGGFQPLSPQERSTYENQPIDFVARIESHLRFLEERGGVADPTSGYGSWSSLLSVLRTGGSPTGRIDIRA